MKKNNTISVALFCIAMLLSFQTQSQTSKKVEVNVSVSEAKFIGKTPELRNLVPRAITNRTKRDLIKKQKKSVPNFMGRSATIPVNPHALPIENDVVRQSSVERTPGRVVAPLVNIDGLRSSFFPNDPTGDVGLNYYIQSVNATAFRIYDKNGNPASPPINANTLWNTIGFSSAGDPIVMFDQEAGRWLITEFPSGNQLLVAISETSDPFGSWMAYNFATPNFPDYPKYGIWNNSYVVTTNEIGANLQVYLIDRQAILNGNATAMIQRLTLPGSGMGPGFFACTPVDWSGQMPADDTTDPMVMKLNDDAWGQTDRDMIDIFSIDLDWENPDSTEVTLTSIETAPFDSRPCASQGIGCIPQKNGNGIDGIPEIIMHQSHYRSFENHQSMVFNFITDADPGNNLSGIRWVELRKTMDTDWTLYQEGTFAPDDGLHRFMGSIAMDGAGNIGLAYSVSSPDTWPGLRFTGRNASDPLGEMTIAEYEITDGFSTNPSRRFGDYAHMTIDPINDNTFWFTGEYMAEDEKGTRIVAFKVEKDTIDLSPVALVTPEDAPDLGVGEEVSIRVTNFGIDTVDKYFVGYTFMNGAPVIEEVNGPLLPDSSYTHTFGSGVDMLEVREYEFTLFTSTEGDKAIFNDTINVTVNKLPRFDVGATGINGLDGFTCGSMTEAEIVITNFGTEVLTSAKLEITLNGVITDSVDWTGALDPGENATINIVLNDLIEGDNVISVSAFDPNNITDENMVNNDAQRVFDVLPDGAEITLELTLDDFPQETTWSLLDGSGTVIYTGGPYDSTYVVVTENWCLKPTSCYFFRIQDSASDGICCDAGEGSYKISDADGKILLAGDGQFGSQEVSRFCATFECLLEIEADVSNVTAEGASDGIIMVTAINGVGEYMYSLDGVNFQEENIFSGLPVGEYTIHLVDANDCTATLSVTIDTQTATKDESIIYDLEVIPNPTDGYFRINVEGLKRSDVFLPIRIYDVSGNLVMSSKLVRYNDTYTGPLSLANHPSGNYFVRFLDESIDRLVIVVKR